MVATIMTLVFVLGYVFIAIEHKTRVNKSAVALILCCILWSIFILLGNKIDPSITTGTVNKEILDALGSASEILFFLIGAMTIVEIIDLHGGFDPITRVITATNPRKLLWIIVIISFLMSAVLDNMTTTIVMIMVARKLVTRQSSRLLIASAIVIAANSGGAWSPIGDVTTIMLWMRGNLTAGSMITWLVLPSLVSVIIPTLLISRMMPDAKSSTTSDTSTASVKLDSRPHFITPKESMALLILGILLLLLVPIYKTVTGLPPYMAMIGGLGIIWVATEIMYDRKDCVKESLKERVSNVLSKIDLPTILFFLGILMSVSALESAGILGDMSSFLSDKVKNVYLIGSAIGVLSSVIDNVPLVAASMGMYPIDNLASVMAGQPDSYIAMFQPDGLFWHLLAYAAGVGGSLLIIGSAAGVVAMGLENINFGWYLRKITLKAFIGYIAGIAVFAAEMLIFG